MALQTSGQISIDNLRSEFGDTPGDDGLNEYYRGGTYVPNTAQNSAVPTGGQIALSNFYGAAAAIPIPFTDFMRRTTAADAVYGSRNVVSGIANAQVAFAVRLRRADPYVYLEVREIATAQSSTWYNTGGGGTALSTGYVTMGRFNLSGITAVFLSWSTGGSGSGTFNVTGNNNVFTTQATFAATNGLWQSVAAGQSIGLFSAADVTAECFQSRTATRYAYITAYARRTGYIDTALGTYRITHVPSARSNNCL
jgi:hypothetical protein